MQLESYPQRNERVIAKGVSESLVLSNLDNGEYYKLDEAGGKVSIRHWAGDRPKDLVRSYFRNTWAGKEMAQGEAPGGHPVVGPARQFQLGIEQQQGNDKVTGR